MTPAWLLWPLRADQATSIAFVFLYARAPNCGSATPLKSIPKISKPAQSRPMTNGETSWPPSVLLRRYPAGVTQRENKQDGTVTCCRTDGGRPLLPLCLFLHLSPSVILSVSVSQGKAHSSSRQSTCNILRQQAGVIAGSMARSLCGCKYNHWRQEHLHPSFLDPEYCALTCCTVY